jgi:hypothetical protein
VNEQHRTGAARRRLRGWPSALVGCLLTTPLAIAETAEELQRRVDELTREMERQRLELERSQEALREAQRELSEVRAEADASQAEAEVARAESEAGARPVNPKIEIGPVTVGGAIRANYVFGTYVQDDPGNGPNRGGHGGNLELDTFRINLALDHDNWIGAVEYRWYPDAAQPFPASYNFLHTGWVGYRFDDDSHVEVGVNRVPFGAGPYGVAQSYMFDMHYYLGLADDMDLGVKYVTRWDDWRIDLAYYLTDEGTYNGRSLDSTRYSFDAVRWNESVDADGNVIYGGAENGYDERNQFNLRAIREFRLADIPTEAGFSLQYGQLDGKRVDDGDHWAAAVHMLNRFDGFTLGTQLTRYEYDIDADNPWRTDKLLPMGAFDFPWFTATEAWVAAASLSYEQPVPSVPWLDKVVPYVEYSHVIKDEDAFNDSQMFSLGAQWYSGGWLVYTDLVFANGNWFIGNESDDGADNYNRVDGVGDWGANGNDKWNYRFTINFGYYF